MGKQLQVLYDLEIRLNVIAIDAEKEINEDDKGCDKRKDSMRQNATVDDNIPVDLPKELSKNKDRTV